jgi:O-antigen ligase
MQEPMRRSQARGMSVHGEARVNSGHLITVAVALCMAWSVFGAEWMVAWKSESTSGYVFWWRAASHIGPSVCLLFISVLMTGVWSEHRSTGRLIFVLVGGVLPLVSTMVQAFEHLDVNREALADYPMLGLVQAALFGLMGYWLAQDRQEAGWLLRTLALWCAVGSTLGWCARVAGLEDYPLMVPSMFVGLIFLFGHCWYLHQWLNSQRTHLLGVLGIAACSPEIWITFNKPIVFSASVASLFLIGYSIWATGRPGMVLKRLSVLAVLAAGLLWAANALTDGRVAQTVEDTAYTRFLKQEVGSQISLDDDTFLPRASGGRLGVWEKAITQIRQHPLFGSGFDLSFPTDDPGVSIYVHNWYLELLVSLGCVGSFSIFAALLWWLRLVTRRRVISQAGDLVGPCLACIVGLMAFNLGSSIRIFFSMTSFAVLLMAICTRLADGSIAVVATNKAGRRSSRARGVKLGKSGCGDTHVVDHGYSPT